MSAQPVDVLAVLWMASNEWHGKDRDRQRMADEARAAVAEMMEDARNLLEVLDEDDAPNCIRALRASLARCGGGQ